MSIDERKINAIKDYFKRKTIQYKEQASFLTSDNRSDEAVFAKVQLNVYDIFNTLFSAALKSCGSNDENVREFFLKKTEEIPKNWIVSLQYAEQNGDIKKTYIEKIKLNTAVRIKKDFKELWEAIYE